MSSLCKSIVADLLLLYFGHERRSCNVHSEAKPNVNLAGLSQVRSDEFLAASCLEFKH